MYLVDLGISSSSSDSNSSCDDYYRSHNAIALIRSHIETAAACREAEWVKSIVCRLPTRTDGVNLIYRQYLLWKKLMRIRVFHFIVCMARHGHFVRPVCFALIKCTSEYSPVRRSGSPAVRSRFAHLEKLEEFICKYLLFVCVRHRLFNYHEKKISYQWGLIRVCAACPILTTKNRIRIDALAK